MRYRGELKTYFFFLIQAKISDLQVEQHFFPFLGDRVPPREMYSFGILHKGFLDRPQTPQQVIIKIKKGS
jgi:hypothetical protein